MTTPQEDENEDLHNLEHSGDWDHGVEPDVLDNSFSNEDDLKGHDEDIFAGPKRLVQQVRTSFTKVMHDLSDRAAEVRNDEHLKEEMENHTEEEVAGMKLCVSKTIHQDSFSAPC